MKATVLGSGTCAVRQERACACYFIEAGELKILLDIGFGSLRQMAEAGIDYRDINAIICTHLHLDHIGDLAAFLFATRYTPGFTRAKRLPIIGPRGLRAFLQRSRDLYGDWLLPADQYELTIVEMNSEQYQLGDCLIEALTMQHTENANGYRVTHNKRALAYSGDTGPCDEIVRLCQNADLALIECSFPDDLPFEYHLTPSQAARVAQQAAVKKLVLTHFYPMMDAIDVKALAAAVFSGDIEIAEDFKTFDI